MDDQKCSICQNPRFDENATGPLVKKMNSFFVMRDLKDIQRSLYRGKYMLL